MQTLDRTKHCFVLALNQVISSEVLYAAEKVASDELALHYANIIKNTTNIEALYQIEKTCGNDLKLQAVKSLATQKRVDLEHVNQLTYQLEEAFWSHNLQLFNSALNDANLKYKQYMKNTIQFFEKERVLLQKTINVDDKVANVLCVHIEGM